MEAELTFVRQRRRGLAPDRRWRWRPRRRRWRAFSRASAASRRPAEAASIRVHHSSSSSPTPTTSRARFDPRSGFGGLEYENYAALPGQPHDRALPPPAPPAEEGPDGGRQRAREADCLLPRPRRARAHPLGAPRRRALVEPGLRSRRLSRRLPRRAAARGRQPARHPLQRHQLGASLDARLEHRRPA